MLNTYSLISFFKFKFLIFFLQAEIEILGVFPKR